MGMVAARNGFRRVSLLLHGSRRCEEELLQHNCRKQPLSLTIRLGRVTFCFNILNHAELDEKLAGKRVNPVFSMGQTELVISRSPVQVRALAP
jgi:hypothetical protein